MSYIPRPRAATAAVGRPDEIRSASSGHSSNAAAIAQLFATPKPAASHATPVQLPPSTRASISKALNNAKQPLPPQVPDMLSAGDSASIASSSTTARAGTDAAPPARTHRRTVSAGDELKLVVQQEPDAAGAAQTHSGKSLSKLVGLSALRLTWGQNARASRHGGAADVAQTSQWTAEEVSTLASISAQYWRCSSAVDTDAVAAELHRSPREVRDMLEYMLQGYVRFGGGAFWAAERPDMIVAWAAREFPRSPLLNPSSNSSSSALARSRSRLDSCLAVLRCRPQNSTALSDMYIADTFGAIPSAQNVVGDFRFHDVDTLSLAQRQPPSASPATSPRIQANSETSHTATAQNNTTAPADAAKVVATNPATVEPHAIQGNSALGHARHRASSNHSQTEKQGQQPDTAPTTSGDGKHDGNSDTVMQWGFKAGTTTVPLFTGGLRNHQALNTLTRDSRTRRAKRGSFRVEPSLTAVLDGRPPQPISTTDHNASFTFALSPTKPAVVAMSDKGTSPAEMSGMSVTRQRAHTVAHTDVADQAANLTRLSRDSGNVDVSELRYPAASIVDDAVDHVPARLAPSKPESDLDAWFSDISADVRQMVRSFVSQFVLDYPSDFQQRVRALQSGKDGLCMTIDNFTDLEYNSDAFMKAIDTIYRYVGGSVIYTCNIFFHVQLLHAIQAHRIPVTDHNWLRINEFATRVLNKKIEDAQYVVMEEYTKSKNASSSGGTSTSANRGSALDSISIADKEGMPAPMLPSISGSKYDSIVGNEHLSPFDLAFYMDKLAHGYVKFFLQNYSDEIMERARNNSYRPMPVALCVDEDRMKSFDVNIRNLLIAFIWEDIPSSTLESKEITLLRSLELFNGEIADRCSFRLANMFQLMHRTKNEDGPADQDPVISDVAAVKEMPTAGLAQALGKSFARQYFDDDKNRFLEAMMHDHPFRPIDRHELKEWMARESSPFGDDIDYRLNTRLYKYLRRLRVRPSDRQWMQASSSATLSMIRRVKNAIFDKGYVEHIDVDDYAQRFKDIVRDARSSSDSGSSAKSDTQGRSEDPSKMHLYAFGKVPGWVSLSTESQTASKAASKDTAAPAAAAAANPKPAARPSMAQSQKRSSTPSGVGVSDEQAAVRGDIGSDLNGSPSANGKEVTQVASGLHPRVNGMQQQSVGPAEESTDRSTLVQRSNQSKDNASLPGVFQHYTVPMPMPNGSYQHLSHPMQVPHMYLPYASPDTQQHVPVLYPSIVPQYPVVQTTTTTDGQANMDAVMRKFDEMQEMFRQMQAERWQGQA